MLNIHQDNIRRGLPAIVVIAIDAVSNFMLVLFWCLTRSAASAVLLEISRLVQSVGCILFRDGFVV